MTEPPDPRRSEEGGGEQDPELRGYEIEDEELPADEWLDLLEEDTALDALHNAPPGTTGDPLASLVDRIKGVVDAGGNLPLTDRAERGENVLEPRNTDEGNNTVSAQDESARLLQLADSANSRYMCAEIIQDLDGVLGQIQEALGANHSRLGEALGPISEAKAQAEALAAALENAFGQLRDIGNAIG